MPCRRWGSIRPVLSDSCHPFLGADGKAAYWLIAGLLLLTLFSGAVIRYWAGGIADKQSPSVVAPDQEKVFHSPHRYKIERAARPAADAVVPEAPLQTGDKEIVGGPPAVSVPMESAPPVQPPETVQQPVEAVSGEEAMSVREEAGGQIGDADGEQPRPDKTAAAPDAPEEPGRVPLEETGTSSPQSGESAGKRFFVNTDVANVRDRPSMESEVIFQIRNGCPVTVTDKRDGWYRVNMDDGRPGWVFHTLLAVALVPGKDILPVVREIKAIRVEPPVDQTAKVLFELSAPYVPEILVLDEMSPRIVCDFMDAKPASDIGRRIAVNNGIIRTIRIGLHHQPQVKVRVVLDLEPGRHYEPRHVSGDGEASFVLEIKAVGNP
ncbi:MAG: SH3 domain-containing protein [Candidatus Desulfacyla sp.]